MKTLLETVCVSLVCLLMGVPVCKRLRCVHVNKHVLLCGQLVQSNDPGTAPVRTLTSKQLPSWLAKEFDIKTAHMEKKKHMMETKLLFSSNKGKECAFKN